MTKCTCLKVFHISIAVEFLDMLVSRIIKTLSRTVEFVEVRFLKGGVNGLKSVKDTTWDTLNKVQNRLSNIKVLSFSELTEEEKIFLLLRLQPLAQAGILVGQISTEDGFSNPEGYRSRLHRSGVEDAFAGTSRHRWKAGYHK
jgi:hypothetical protein